MKNKIRLLFLGFCLLAAMPVGNIQARDLPEIKASGVLRHLGIPYANFVKGPGDGLDVELVQMFAKHLGVKYEYVAADWDNIIADLTGHKIVIKGNDVVVTGPAPVRGDVIANGLTILPWREKVLKFSEPTFPTQVWLVTRADAPITPITPTGSIQKDIALTRQRLKGLSLLCKTGTCLDPALYNLEEAGARAQLFPGSLNDLAPAVIFGESSATLLDVPDALVALDKFPGKVKIIGPLTEPQEMALGFANSAPQLRDAFNRFLAGIKKDGTYNRLVKKYYPSAFNYFPKFFNQ